MEQLAGGIDKKIGQQLDELAEQVAELQMKFAASQSAMPDTRVAAALKTVDRILSELTKRVIRLENECRALRNSIPGALPSALQPHPELAQVAPQELPSKDDARNSSRHEMVHAGSQGWRERLYTPTYLTKLNGHYFLVDCWHHRILFNEHFDEDLRSWKTLDETLAGPHSIDSDGINYVADDTGAHGLQIYQRAGTEFRVVNRVDRLGDRPHRTRYDATTRRFLVIAKDFYALSISPTGTVQRITEIKLDFLQGSYTRSFTVHQGLLYFVSGNGFIHETVLQGDFIQVLRRYRVPEQAQSMNDLWFGPNKIYITASPRAIFEAASLADLDRGNCRDIYAQHGFKGTPYYFSEFDGKLFIPEIIEHSCIAKFQPQPDGGFQIDDRLFDCGPPNADSLLRYNAYPK